MSITETSSLSSSISSLGSATGGAVDGNAQLKVAQDRVRQISKIASAALVGSGVIAMGLSLACALVIIHPLIALPLIGLCLLLFAIAYYIHPERSASCSLRHLLDELKCLPDSPQKKAALGSLFISLVQYRRDHEELTEAEFKTFCDEANFAANSVIAEDVDQDYTSIPASPQQDVQPQILPNSRPITPLPIVENSPRKESNLRIPKCYFTNEIPPFLFSEKFEIPDWFFEEERQTAKIQSDDTNNLLLEGNPQEVLGDVNLTPENSFSLSSEGSGVSVSSGEVSEDEAFGLRFSGQIPSLD